MLNWSLLGEMLLILSTSLVLGGVIGLERELADRWAGLRTHMLVALGSAVFVLSGSLLAKEAQIDLSRIIQGVAAGIGFIGAGTILKLDKKQEIRGLTTAASLWLAAAVGVTCGLKMYELAICTTVLCTAVLRGMQWLQKTVDFEAIQGKKSPKG